MHIRRVTANVKGAVDAVLGEKTLVVGPNASGKTGLVTALKLGLRGRDDAAAPVELMAYAPGGKGTLKVLLDVSDGSVVEFAVKGSTAKAHKPIWTRNGETVSAPVGAFLVDDLVVMLKGDAVKTVRPALLRLIAGDDAEVATKIGAAVPEAFRAQWNSAWFEEEAKAGTVLDTLVAIAKRLRSEAKAASDAASVLETTADVAPIAAPTPTQMDAARRDVAAAQEADRAAGEYRSLRQRQMALQTQLSGAPEAGVEVDVVGLTALRDELKTAATVLGRSLAWNECLTCGHVLALGDEPTLRHRLMDRLTAVERLLSAPTAKARTELTHIDIRLDALVPLLERDLDVGAAEARLVELLRASEGAKQAGEAREAALKEAAKADAAAALAKVSDRLVVGVLKDSTAAFEAAASACLPDGALKVQLFDGERAVCKILWQRANGDVVPWRGFSGAERAFVLAAMASAVASRRTEAVKVVCIDDCWVDPAMLPVLMRALGTLSVQVILCAATDYGISVPEGWTVVRTGA